VSRIEQSGRISLRRPKPPIKGGSAPEEEEEWKYRQVMFYMILFKHDL
jgi:hypothetical protein